MGRFCDICGIQENLTVIDKATKYRQLHNLKVIGFDFNFDLCQMCVKRVRQAIWDKKPIIDHSRQFADLQEPIKP